MILTRAIFLSVASLGESKIWRIKTLLVFLHEITTYE